MSNPNPTREDLAALFGPKKSEPIRPNESNQEPPQPSMTPAGGNVEYPMLPSNAIAALQRLLMRGVVLSRTHEDHYKQLVLHRPFVKSILENLKLHVAYQEEKGLVVLLRQSDASEEDHSESLRDTVNDDEEGYALLRSTPLKLLHSLVLMVLATYYDERTRAGDRIIRIDINELKDRLQPYWPLVNAEKRSDNALSGAVSTLESHCILLPIRGQKDHREISPAVTVALDIENATLMVKEYSRLAGANDTSDDDPEPAEVLR